jgi:hypothetical protein
MPRFLLYSVIKMANAMKFEISPGLTKFLTLMSALFLQFSPIWSICRAEESIVFQAIPSKRSDTNLSKQEAVKYSLVIKKVGGKYVWVSRNDTKLIYNLSGIYHIFTAVNGSGFVSIVDNRILPDTFRAKGSPDIEYGEHVRNGVSVISYYGAGDFILP